MKDVNMQVPIAKYKNGKVLSLDLAKNSSLLVSYPKWMPADTTILDSILGYSFKNIPFNQCRMIVVDLQDAGLTKYDGAEQLLTPVITMVERAIAAYQWLTAESRKRLEMFGKVGVKTIDEYNDLAGYSFMGHILVVTVDISELIMFAPNVAFKMIHNILRDAKNAGIIFVATTKHPKDSASQLFDSRISYKANDQVGTVRYKPTKRSKESLVQVMPT